MDCVPLPSLIYSSTEQRLEEWLMLCQAPAQCFGYFVGFLFSGGSSPETVRPGRQHFCSPADSDVTMGLACLTRWQMLTRCWIFFGGDGYMSRDEWQVWFKDDEDELLDLRELIFQLELELDPQRGMEARGLGRKFQAGGISSSWVKCQHFLLHLCQYSLAIMVK